ncbi:tyrosine protein phosphatase 1 [Entomophthora muscae]|uniref:Tyrosine protein phosphatase 1 n=1 Tax=Entomophthora muscae TaxID=34485 RepID=A0ACC2RJC7_9FUNG|nr:tyrosine protein phosphatase 1 [Entomophthora muscae]
MVYEFRSPLILVLSKEFEGNVAKYQRYWPKTVGDCILHFQDNLQVELLKENQHPTHADVTMAYFKVHQTTDLKENYVLLVTQIRFDGWPDMGVPSSPSIILSLIDIFHSELSASHAKNSKASNLPTIHCSAGVGRTGTFCAIDSGLCLLKHWDRKSDMVLHVIQQLRQQRMLAVETYQQFCFVYQSIHYFQQANSKG